MKHLSTLFERLIHQLIPHIRMFFSLHGCPVFLAAHLLSISNLLLQLNLIKVKPLCHSRTEPVNNFLVATQRYSMRQTLFTEKFCLIYQLQMRIVCSQCKIEGKLHCIVAKCHDYHDLSQLYIYKYDIIHLDCILTYSNFANCNKFQ